MAGLAAARQLHNFGYQVKLLEARDRVGGRCSTDWSLGAGIDLGASIITGLEGNPLTVLCQQLDTKLHILNYECPIFDHSGKEIDKEIDQRMEKSFNTILDLSKNMEKLSIATKGADVKSFSLLGAIEALLGAEGNLSSNERSLFNWHIANLEYGCAANLDNVSLQHWDQDDGNEWGGEHCLLKEGYNSITNHLTRDIDVEMNQIVSSIEYDDDGVKIVTQNQTIEADAVLVTLPLGVLKDGQVFRIFVSYRISAVKFSPELPSWKTGAIERLGFGLLNKVMRRDAS